MKNSLIFKILVVNLFLFSSCLFFEEDTDLSGITSVYPGQYNLEKSKVINSKDGKSRLIKLNVTGNFYIDEGLVTANRISNNCAILLGKHNPEIIATNQSIEVVINKPNKEYFTYEYKGSELKLLTEKHIYLEGFVSQFVKGAIEGKIDTSSLRLEQFDNYSSRSFDDFINGFKAKIPKTFVKSRITGFHKETNIEGNDLYIIIFSMISESNFHQIGLMIFEEINDEVYLKKIKY